MLGYTFQTNRSTFQLGTINADGSGNHLQPDGRAKSIFSPNGNRELVFAFDGSGSAQLFVRNVDGSGEMPLTPTAPGVIFNASWSPDGTKIAYLLSQTGNGADAELWTMNADGTNQTKITQDGFGKLRVDWGMTASGSKIAYIGGRPGIDPSDPCYGWQLWVVDPDGSNAACVSSVAAYGQDLAYQVTDLEWSPDGTQFAMTASYPQGDPSVVAQPGNVWIAPRTGGPAVNLTPSSGYGELHALDLAWSPDATRLALSGNIPQPDPVTGGARFDAPGVYTMASTGFPATRVTPSEPVGSVAMYELVDWQPCTPGVTTACTSVAAPAPDGTVDPNAPGGALRPNARVVTFAKNGTGKLPLTCSQQTTRCIGTAKIQRATKTGRIQTLATGKFSIAPKTTGSTSIKLTAAGTKLLAATPKLVRAQIVLTSTTGAKTKTPIGIRGGKCHHC
jgi:dipeptidyl aminopeptidase/acylaminoacyl peptidase